MKVAVDIGSIFVELNVDSVKFDTAMEKAQDQVKNVGTNMRSLGNQLTRMGAILTAFGGGVLLFMTKMAQRASDALGDTSFSEAMNAMQDSLDGLSITIGERAIPTLVGLIDKLTGLVDAFSQSNPAIFDFIVTAGILLAIIAAVLGPIALLSGIVIKLGAAFTALSGFLGPIIAGAGGLSSLALILGEVTIVLGLLWLAWEKNWGNIRQHFDQVIAGIGMALLGLGQLFQGVFDIIFGIITLDSERIWAGISNLALGIWNILNGAFTFIVNGVIGFFFDMFVGAMKWTFNLLAGIDKAFATMKAGIMTVMVDILAGVFMFLSNLVNGAINILNGFISAVNNVRKAAGLGEFSLVGQVSQGFGFNADTARAGIAANLQNEMSAIEAKRQGYQQVVNFSFNDVVIAGAGGVDDLARIISEAIANAVRQQNQYGSG